ncbi:MAG: ATP-binding protein [Armatimonadetes bacterium]|nr:ATP-binding protein [Armatimonadota bacterium]
MDEHCIPDDPGEVRITDLLTKEQVVEGGRAFRLSKQTFGGIFIFDGPSIRLADEVYGESAPEYPEEMIALIAKLRDTGQEQMEFTSDGQLMLGHPIWLHYEGKQYAKGCFAGVPPKLNSPERESNRQVAKFVADMYSERISGAFAVHVARRDCRALEQELKQGSKLAGVIDNLGAEVLLIDRDMRVVWHNAILAERRGVADMVGGFCHEVFYGLDTVCDDCLVKRTFETGRPQVGRLRKEFPRVGMQYLSVTTSPVIDQAGQVNQVLELIHDITPAYLAESELERYKRLVNNSEDFMMICDSSGDILATNRRMNEGLGYGEGELIGKPCSTLFVVDQGARANSAVDMSRLVGMAMETIHLARKDGGEIPTQLMVVYDREHAVYEAIFRDISERLRMEEELRERSEELQAQNQKVLAAAEERNRFFRSVSHELRTPLTSIIGFAEILLEDTDEPLTDRQQMKLKRVVVNSHKLLGMVNDLLDLSKIEAGRMEIHWGQVEIGEFLEHLVSNMMPLAAGKQLNVKLDVQSKLFGIITDEQRLSHIMVNLISNAIKFTTKGTITVSASESDSSLSISVQDTGVGIPKEELELVFKEFYRGRGKRASEQGTGLGLTIAQRLALLLGGEITIRSTVGEGSTFTLRLPLAPGAHLDPDEKHSEVVAAGNG